MKRLFKKSQYTSSDNNKKYIIYEPTINKKEGILIDDRFKKQIRLNTHGSLDAPFSVAMREKIKKGFK